MVLRWRRRGTVSRPWKNWSRPKFDVIVLDLQMPRMDGRAFFREMTARGHAPQVVILSAYGAEEAQGELKVAAAVPKPFDPDDLIETVRRVASDRA